MTNIEGTKNLSKSNYKLKKKIQFNVAIYINNTGPIFYLIYVQYKKYKKIKLNNSKTLSESNYRIK